MKIGIAGIGYGGRHNAILPAHHARRIKTKDVEIIVDDTALAEPEFYCLKVTHGLARLKQMSDVIVTNRTSVNLSAVEHKVCYLFGND